MQSIKTTIGCPKIAPLSFIVLGAMRPTTNFMDTPQYPQFSPLPPRQIPPFAAHRRPLAQQNPWLFISTFVSRAILLIAAIAQTLFSQL